MEYFFDSWDQLRERLKRGYLMLFLDYDGTLAPIVNNPGQALLSPEVKNDLKKLADTCKCGLVIISGRSLDDIKKRVGIEGVIYVGNHGLEIEGPKIKFRNILTERTKTAFKEIKGAIDRKLNSIKGIFVEDKKYSMSVHYRLAEQKDVPSLKEGLDAILKTFATKEIVRIKHGKKVVEIRPAVDWDKGKVVLWLLARHGFALKDKEIAAIYIGDDATDEDAFKALKDKALTIFVGEPRPFSARYYVRNTDEVARFLRDLLALREGG